MIKIGSHKAEKPKLEYIIGEENLVLSIFLQSHLVLEALIVGLILTKKTITAKKIENLTASDKIKTAYRLKLISDELYTFLREICRLRNKFAHLLGYHLTKEDVHLLIKLAAESPEIDFSDDMQDLDKGTLYEWYTDTAGVLEEMFKHAAMDIGFMIMENGGDYPFDE